MPKRTTYLLRWSEEQQSYEMMGGLPDAAIPQPTSPEWLAWLSGISSFAFVCRSGTHYTARKEKLQRGGAYWATLILEIVNIVLHFLGYNQTHSLFAIISGGIISIIIVIYLLVDGNVRRAFRTGI